MNEENRSLKSTGVSRVVLAVIFVGVVVAGLFFLVGQMATAHNAAARVRCQNNLKELYPLILRHVNIDGHLPVDEDGHLSISQLHGTGDDSHLLSIDLDACGGESIDSCYLVGVNILSDSEDGIDDSSREILIYDRPGNHLQRLGNGMLEQVNGIVQEEAQLLLANGSVISWRGNSPAYADWAKRYPDGTGKPYPPGVE